MQVKLQSLTRKRKNILWLFASLLSVLPFIGGCATTEIAEIELCPLEDPFTEEGYCVNVITQKERVIEKEKWRLERRNYVMMSPESWAKVKTKHYKDCYSTECKQTLSNIENLFKTVDEAVKKAALLKKGKK